MDGGGQTCTFGVGVKGNWCSGFFRSGYNHLVDVVGMVGACGQFLRERGLVLGMVDRSPLGYGVWSADTLKKNWGETREDLKRNKMAAI